MTLPLNAFLPLTLPRREGSMGDIASPEQGAGREEVVRWADRLMPLVVASPPSVDTSQEKRLLPLPLLPQVPALAVGVKEGEGGGSVDLNKIPQELLTDVMEVLASRNALSDHFLEHVLRSGVSRLCLVGAHGIRKSVLSLLATNGGTLKVLDLSLCRQVNNKLLTGILDSCSSSLTTLRLDGCVRVSDAAFVAPKRAPFKSLEELSLGKLGQLTEAAVRWICSPRFSRSLRVLNLSECKVAVTDSILEECLLSPERLPYLNKLHVSFCSLLSDLGFLKLAAQSRRMPHLVDLDLSGCKLSDEAVCCLPSLAPNLAILNLGFCPVSDCSVSSLLSSCPRLASLHLPNSQVEGAFLRGLREAAELEDLDLSWNSKVSEEALSPLLGFPSDPARGLRRLYLNHAFGYFQEGEGGHGGEGCLTPISAHLLEGILRRHGPTLEILELEAVPPGSVDSSVLHILKHCPNLTSLVLSLDQAALKKSVFDLGVGGPSSPFQAIGSLHSLVQLKIIAPSLPADLVCPSLRFPNLPSLKDLSLSLLEMQDRHLDLLLLKRTGEHTLRSLELKGCALLSESVFRGWIIRPPRPPKEDLLLKIDEVHAEEGELTANSKDEPPCAALLLPKAHDSAPSSTPPPPSHETSSAENAGREGTNHGGGRYLNLSLSPPMHPRRFPPLEGFSDSDGGALVTLRAAFQKRRPGLDGKWHPILHGAGGGGLASSSSEAEGWGLLWGLAREGTSIFTERAMAIQRLVSLRLQGPSSFSDNTLDDLSKLLPLAQKVEIEGLPASVSEEVVPVLRRRCRLLRSLFLSSEGGLKVKIESSKAALQGGARAGTKRRR